MGEHVTRMQWMPLLLLLECMLQGRPRGKWRLKHAQKQLGYDWVAAAQLCEVEVVA